MVFKLWGYKYLSRRKEPLTPRKLISGGALQAYIRTQYLNKGIIRR